jgi:hypothetical protein
MDETTSSSAAGQPRQELILTRILGARAALVFKAWTYPEHAARCWGPRGAPVPSANFVFEAWSKPEPIGNCWGPRAFVSSHLAHRRRVAGLSMPGGPQHHFRKDRRNIDSLVREGVDLSSTVGGIWCGLKNSVGFQAAVRQMLVAIFSSECRNSLNAWYPRSIMSRRIKSQTPPGTKEKGA